MAFKGFNSILFDFYSLVDKELSLIKYIASEYKDNALESFDKHSILYTKDDDWVFKRLYDKEDVFKSLIIDNKIKEKSDELLERIIERDEKKIWLDHAFPTSIQSLIGAYKKAGNGVIKTSIQCETEAQRSYIEKTFPGTQIEFGKREDIDMGKYGRLIVGNYKDALEYNLEEPKSILILNFRENFIENDITTLRPELIINLGDIHEIEIVSAYKDI